MKNIKTFKLFESANENFIKDFLTDFGVLISLNLSQITKMGKDQEATIELTNMMKEFRSPKINGMTYFDFIKDNINSICKNPKGLSSILNLIKGWLEYLEPRIIKYVKDGAAPNVVDYKTKWLERISNLKKDYVKIIS